MGGQGGCGHGRHERRRVLGELEVPRLQGLHDGLAVLGGDEDEVRVVRGDEEDGDAGHGQGGGQLHNPAPRVHAAADDREDQVGVLGDADPAGGVPGQALDRGLEDIPRPAAVADHGALDGGDADVEEAVLVVDAHAVVPVGGEAVDPAVRQENLRYRLEEGRV